LFKDKVLLIKKSMNPSLILPFNKGEKIGRVS